MQYKTMVLELLRERTELYEQLRLKRKVLPTLEILARELKVSHETWQQALAAAKPNSQPNQIASEALELALKELSDRLPPASPPHEAEPLSLDGAMAFIQSPTSNG